LTHRLFDAVRGGTLKDLPQAQRQLMGENTMLLIHLLLMVSVLLVEVTTNGILGKPMLHGTGKPTALV
jgi:hypothetical protein